MDRARNPVEQPRMVGGIDGDEGRAAIGLCGDGEVFRGFTGSLTMGAGASVVTEQSTGPTFGSLTPTGSNVTLPVLVTTKL